MTAGLTPEQVKAWGSHLTWLQFHSLGPNPLEPILEAILVLSDRACCTKGKPVRPEEPRMAIVVSDDMDADAYSWLFDGLW